MFFNEHSPIYFEVPISHNKTETTWVYDGVTMGYVRRRINEISGDYFVELTSLSLSATGAVTADNIPTSTTSLKMAENQYHDGYSSRNILIVFGLGMVLIIVLLLLNCYGLIVLRRSRHHIYTYLPILQNLEKTKKEYSKYDEMDAPLCSFAYRPYKSPLCCWSLSRAIMYTLDEHFTDHPHGIAQYLAITKWAHGIEKS
ncbi:unnamed protein product [Rotaria sp. Silwood2]|nr:unnamed protein product [Rotaria sp. Silwood2]CAF3017151.1 unnamed protein product [Rotaria sp. Silwood2]CAF3353190.1 unnamed protein product [Rotaria sp. Silwood2]CAF4010999.1 unnamed protein product [Rotaria sp. Silwood2]CAF4192690.1 unnamed protein product [Rotaria sp. Silwood2]